MRNRMFLLVAMGVMLSVVPWAAAQQVRRLPVKVYEDKMKAGWIGQMIGVGWGGPTEFRVKGEIMPAGQDAAVEAGDGQPARQRRLLRRNDVPARRWKSTGSTSRSARRASTSPTAAIRSGTPTRPAATTCARASPRPTAAIRSSTSTPTTSTTRSRPTSAGIISPGLPNQADRPGRDLRPADELRRRRLRRASSSAACTPRRIFESDIDQDRRGRPAVHSGRKPVRRNGPRHARAGARRTPTTGRRPGS